MNLSGPIVVIGAGSAGLMAAETLLKGGAKVDLFEGTSSAGRKFLVAGKGGLNLTHSEPFEQFVTRYGERRSRIEPLLKGFGPAEMRQWAAGLGIETFTGTSGRVFPVGMKSTPLLRAWLERLRAGGANIHFHHKWTGWNEAGQLRFETPQGVAFEAARAVILALGGASWPVTGSTGEWVKLLEQQGIAVAALKPSNCGFNVDWTDHFRDRFAGFPLKAVVALFKDSRGRSFHQQGEFIITETGVEGSLIYSCSALLRDEIEATGSATLHLDLAPGYTQDRLEERLARPRGSRSTANHLEKSTGMKGVKTGLLWEYLPRQVFNDPPMLAAAIKDLSITLLQPRPIEEAISSAGGVMFESLDDRLMLKGLPGVFCAGEMLDWEAPTGGYLLTACFASGQAAALGALKWMEQVPTKANASASGQKP